jgi:hypothetical protein
MNYYSRLIKHLFTSLWNNLRSKWNYLFNKKQTPLISKTAVLPEISYKSTIKYFTENIPSHIKIAKVALLCQSHPEGYELTQVFLDGNNQIVLDDNNEAYGQSLLTNKIDEELSIMFRKNDLIILE